MPEQEKDQTKSAEEKAIVHAEAAESWLSDFFMFNIFITRPFIKIIYVLGVLAITLLAFANIFGMMGGFSSYSLVSGLVTLILGNIGWRITCEIWIVFFRLYDVAKSIDNSLKEE